MKILELLFEEEELNTLEKIHSAIKNGRVPGVKPNNLNKFPDEYFNYVFRKFKDFPSIYKNAAIKLAVKRCLLVKELLIVDAYHAYFNNRNKQEAKTTHKQLFTDFENGKIGDKAFEDKIKGLFKDKAKGKEEANKLYEDDNYLVVIPKNFAASCKYGEGTKWCTTGSERMFKNYSDQSPLIIVINKKLDSRNDVLAKVQFHGGTNNAMDAQDKRIDIVDYLDNLPNKIQEILKKYGFNKWNIVLKKASEKGNIEKVKEALKNGADVHINDDYALKNASYNGHTEVVKVLLDAGADIHADKDFALRVASMKGYTEIVKLLLDAGADIHVDKDLALRISSKYGHTEVVKLLLADGANVHAYNNYALKYASDYDHIKIVKLLLNAGADVHADDDYALKMASMKGSTEIVKILLAAGADIHADKDFALRIASEHGHTEVVELLKQHMKKEKK